MKSDPVLNLGYPHCHTLRYLYLLCYSIRFFTVTLVRLFFGQIHNSIYSITICNSSSLDKSIDIDILITLAIDVFMDSYYEFIQKSIERHTAHTIVS